MSANDNHAVVNIKLPAVKLEYQFLVTSGISTEVSSAMFEHGISFRNKFETAILEIIDRYVRSANHDSGHNITDIYNL